MIPEPPPDTGPSQVESLLADYLARRDDGEALDFETLCRAHPTEAAALRKLHDEVERARDVLDLAQTKLFTRSGSAAARLKQRHGPHIDPDVSLDAGPDETHGPATDELVRRLSQHAPATSRYKLVGEIARGGMGAILKVWDLDLRRHLAMKVVLGRGQPASTGTTPALDERELARFLEEAQVTSQLDHPGIVPVHELGLDQDGRVYFTMKLVKGRDLKQIFDLVFAEKEGWNETRALGVILKACEAMAYAHTKGVIHRDLKPANVMVGNFGEVYVMDWGLARVLGRKDTRDIRIAPEFTSMLTSVQTERREEREELSDSPIVTMDGAVIGTPAYMPPEQARGDVDKLGPRSDVYSMGALLYHLLAGHAPYVTRGMRVTNHTVLAMVLQGAPGSLTSLRKDLPADLVAICEKALAREASERYADTLALAEDLRAFLEHRVVSAHETGAWAEARKWVERNKPLAAALAGAVLILIGGIVFSTLKTREAEAARVETAQKNIALGQTVAALDQSNAALTEQRNRADGEAENAKSAALEALRQEEIAKQNLEDVLSLSAIQELSELIQESHRLWPVEPRLVPAYEAWLAKANLLIEGRAADPVRGVERRFGLADHQAELAQIRQRAKPLTDELSSDVEERLTYEFDDARDRWWNGQLAKLVSDLEALRDPKTGLMSDTLAEPFGWGVSKRFAFARTIEERSLSGTDAQRRWDEALAAITSSPKYGGLKLAPQLGLVPIGSDPDSGLWEFAHLQTGDEIQRGPDGKLVVTEQTGLVFVLIPGGKFWMGTQKTDPKGRNFDPQAQPDESPVHEVELSAYFLSKYEMTQGQWMRTAGRNPSFYGPRVNLNGHQHDLRHPVEQVSWQDCMSLLKRLNLTLPSEAQSEKGCRSGSETPWWTGAERELLRGKVNVADQTYVRLGGSAGLAAEWPDLDDGWAVHALVGTFAANPFGLHEVHGNVWEWCLDGYDSGSYEKGGNKDPVSLPQGSATRVNRGGSFYDAASDARSAVRGAGTPEYRNYDLGVRPARACSSSSFTTSPSRDAK